VPFCVPAHATSYFTVRAHFCDACAACHVNRGATSQSCRVCSGKYARVVQCTLTIMRSASKRAVLVVWCAQLFLSQRTVRDLRNRVQFLEEENAGVRHMLAVDRKAAAARMTAHTAHTRAYEGKLQYLLSQVDQVRVA
jgi:hypothetical protein